MAVDLKTRETELATMINQAKALHAELEQKGDKATQEDRDKLERLVADGQTKRNELTVLRGLNELDGFTTGEEKGQKAIEVAQNGGSPHKSWGDLVLGSEEMKRAKHDLERVMVGAIPRIGRKAIYAGSDGQGGYLTQVDRQPEVLDIARQRPRSFLDLVNMARTTVDAVEYVVMSSRTNSAAQVSEYTAGNFGLKPESDLAFELKTAVVKTIATYVLASRQILADAPRLRDLIDNELEYMVETKLETDLITDVLAWSGIQARIHANASYRGGATTDTLAETLRRGITDIYLEFYRPDGIVLHPTQGENLELLRETSPGVGAFLNIYDSATMRVWRVPVVETPAMTSGTALVGQFKLGVTVWDRMQTEILTGQPNDLFLRNAWAILAELRAAWAVTRPLAIEKITGM
jgi:HK97 family phage major capsid protein